MKSRRAGRLDISLEFRTQKQPTYRIWWETPTWKIEEMAVQRSDESEFVR
jgi:hypothetical protein